MSDNLVKRMRDKVEASRIYDDDEELLDEAADRIEKLEMLLHGEKCLRQDLKDTAEAHSKQQRDRIETLEAALRMVVDWDNTLDWEDGPAWGDLMDIARKALEGKDD